MNMWLVLCQAFTFAFLLAQYQIFSEVEAEDHTISAGGWFGDLEKKLNGVMHDVFQTIKRSSKTAQVSPKRRQLNVQDDLTTPDTMFEDFTIAKKYGDIDTNIEEIDTTTKRTTFDMDNGKEFASGLSGENSEAYQNYETNTPQGLQKRKKKGKKNKKKIKPKRKLKGKKVHLENGHAERAYVDRPPGERVQNERHHESKAERVREPKGTLYKEFALEPEPSLKVKKARPHKKKAIKFVKTSVDNKANESESEENAKRGKPVDIIVHIKMNE